MTSTNPPRTRWVRLLTTPSILGVLLAAWMFTQSVSPSLLVRTWLMQGVVSGLAIGLGYGVGTLLTRAGRWLRRRHGWGAQPFAHRLDLQVRCGIGAAVAAYLLWAVIRAVDHHRWTWERLDYERSTYWLVYGGTLLVTVVVAALVFVLGWLFRLLQRRLTRIGRRWLPAWIAGGLAFVVLTWAVLASLNTWVLQRTLDGFNASFSVADLNVDDTEVPPTAPLRSAGPDSKVAWDEAGREGRRFLTRGPDAASITEIAPTPAVEPVRVYVGRASADTAKARVELAVDELERFGAFDRAAILVVVPTGTGWINEQIVQPVEYFHAGDVATVAVQYSHLPSPLAFLAEEHAAGQTGIALVQAVRARIDELPVEERPDLLVAGESLGSFGGSQAFSSLDDMLEQTRATLWIGPPETMHLRREAEQSREPGSSQVSPLIGDGRDIVFANRESDLVGTTPRSVFLQQADDPIVWWDWQTIYDEPDWLEEPLDPAVNPEMTWAPVSTFLNLAVDMVVANDFDEDHGHMYGTQPTVAWQVMLAPGGWDAARITALRERLEEIAR